MTHIFGLRHNSNISNSCINTYSIVINDVYQLFLEIPTTLILELEDLTNADAAVDTAVAVDKVPAEEMESQALAATLAAMDLTSASSEASFIPL